MKKQAAKKIIAFMLVAISVAILFTCKIFANDQPSSDAQYNFSGEEGKYEEFELENFSEDAESKGKFTQRFYVEKESIDDIYLLKIADFETAYSVFLNGKALPSNTTEIDITKLINTGDIANELEIRAERISGSIKVVHTPLLMLGSVSVVPNINTGEITANVSIRNRSYSTMSGNVEVAVYELGIIKKGNSAMHISVGSKEIDFNVEQQLTDTISLENIKINNFDDTRLWTTDNPFIYEIVVTLGENRISSYFCMRTMDFDKETGYFLLNGECKFIKACYVQDGDFSNVKDYKKINSIITKTAISSEMQETADKAGLLLFYDTDLSKLLVIEDETREEIAKIRAERIYTAMALTDAEMSEEIFSDIGVYVSMDADEAGRGDKFNVDVSVVNDIGEDLGDTVATLEVSYKNAVILSESKAFESLKKLGTQGRDVMTREFAFEIPGMIKDGEDITLTIKVKAHGNETTWSKKLTVSGGNTYEASYSHAAIVITLCSVGAVICVATVIAGIRYRREKKK